VEWLIEHWKLSGSVLTSLLSGWFGRRPLGGLWRKGIQQIRLQRRVTELELDLEEERRNTASAIQARDLAMAAVREMAQAAMLIQEAHRQGLVVTIDPSSTAPSSLPDSSLPLRQKPTTRGPLEVP
jgi:hypothetical protein